MPVEYKWYGNKVKKAMNIYYDAFYKGLGELYVNQMSDMAHVQTGLLKNSITWTYKRTYSEFGRDKGPKEGRYIPEDTERVSHNPKKLRVGSAVVYAAAMEKNHQWATKGKDYVQRSGNITVLARRLFRKLFK